MWQGFTLSAWSISWLVALAQSRWSLMALSISEEGLDLAAVLLGVGLVEGEGHEEAASAKLTAGQRNP